MPMNSLVAKEARKLFLYKKESGELIWRVSIGGRSRVGKNAGSINGQGYREIMVYGRTYQASRLIWLIVTGSWPKGEIDHKNLDRSDNCWTNLRLATHSQNQANGQAYKNNRSGLKGIGLPDKKTGRYYPYIQVNKKKIRLGGYASAEEAHRAWVAASIKYRGEFARGR